MVLILLSLIVTVTMIALAVSITRNGLSFGSLIRSGSGKKDFSISGESAVQSYTNSVETILVGRATDGTIVAQG
jgi:hypothetical protein